MRWRLIALSLAVGSVAACKTPPSLAIVGDTVKLRRDDKAPATSSVFDGKMVRLRGARGETLGLQVLHVAFAELRVDGVAIDPFKIRYLDVREPSTAMYGPSRGKGAWPDPLEPSSSRRVPGDVFFDVVIPADATPGVHHGTLTVGTRDLPVELVVEPMTIALSPFVWIWYQPGEIARAEGLPDEDGKLLPLERKYEELVRAHGAYLASDLPPPRFEARLAFLDGTRYWPVRVADDNLRADADFWDRRFATLPQVPFATTVDEPHDAAERAEARKMGATMGKHAKLLRVVTAAPSPDFGDAIDVFISPASRPPHRWTYNGAPPSAGALIIDTDGTALRTWGWIAERYGVELWYAWEGTYYADRYNGGGPTAVLDNPLTFDQRKKHPGHDADWGNGDGVLVYPGPWPSLRLKALRRGLQDRAILEALAACGARDVVDREVRALVPRALDEGKGAAAWPSDEAAWEAARGRLYDAWRARCGKAAAK